MSTFNLEEMAAADRLGITAQELRERRQAAVIFEMTGRRDPPTVPDPDCEEYKQGYECGRADSQRMIEKPPGYDYGDYLRIKSTYEASINNFHATQWQHGYGAGLDDNAEKNRDKWERQNDDE